MSLARFLRTVRHLRARQVLGQLRVRMRGPLRPAPEPSVAPLPVAPPAVPFLPAPAHARYEPPARLRLLGREVDFGESVDWSFGGEGPLWAYHLHHFDYLRDPRLAAAERGALALDWIEGCRGGPGWDPHPMSLRILAWTRLLLTPEALPPGLAPAVAASLASQADTLAGRLETHLLGNHYLSNLLALVFAAAGLRGCEHLRRFEARLRAELAEQVLADGAHCERSPMYHALLLESVLDLWNVGSRRVGPALREALADAAARMLGALAVLTHPDGEIALFADSALAIAQPPPALEGYAGALGLAARGPDPPGVLAQAGYVRLEQGPFTLIASVAGPLPAHQPGHAHCDALSFELSVGRTRVVTDTGVAEYVPGPRRDWARATRAHATVEVGGFEQAELWAAHRIGGRPRVACVSVEPGRSAEATCAGWATPDTVHRRRWRLSARGLEIEDRIEGRARPVRLTLPLAPGLAVELRGLHARVALPEGGRLELSLPEGPAWRLERMPCYPQFGLELERLALVGTAEGFREGRLELRLVG
jgi:uncharacterized heparinase superfamily protein